jgi:hypothetical protein
MPPTLSTDGRWAFGTLYRYSRGETVKGKTAGLLFLGVCAALAMLLITHVLTPIMSGAIFAVALVFLGGYSRGFRRT